MTLSHTARILRNAVILKTEFFFYIHAEMLFKSGDMVLVRGLLQVDDLQGESPGKEVHPMDLFNAEAKPNEFGSYFAAGVDLQIMTDDHFGDIITPGAPTNKLDFILI